MFNIGSRNSNFGEETLNIKGFVAIMVGIIGVLLAILGLQDLVGSEWDTVASPVALVSCMIVVFAFAIYAVKRR